MFRRQRESLRTRQCFVGLSGLLLAIALSTTESQAGDQGKLDFQTERIVVFKDGYCLLVKQALGRTDEAGRLISEQVPDEAILGSVWIDAIAPELEQGEEPADGQVDERRKVKLLSVVAGRTQIDAERNEAVACESLSDLLEANLSQSVTITTVQGDLIQGTLTRLIGAENPTAVSSEDSPFDSELANGASETAVQLKQQISHVIVTTTVGDTALAVSEIRRLQSLTLKTDLARTTSFKRNTKQWVLQFDQSNADVEVRLIYFRSGIRWIPTYRVALLDESSEAVVSLQAELLNEAEDFENTAIDLVVGVPNFRFRDTPSPLSLEAQMRHTLAQAAPHMFSNSLANNRSQVMLSQRSGEWDPGSNAPENALPEVPAELNAAGSQDLFVIHLEPQSLAKGDRSIVPISQQTVACRHLYAWNIAVTRADVETAPTQSGAASPLKLSNNEVWHYIELKNNSDAPWTTGAAMILEGAQPLAQDLLTYTPRGGSVRIPVTVAVDLRGDYDESEIRRELRTLEWDGFHYAKIAKRAAIHLANRKREAINFEITCHVPGTVTKAGEEGAIQLLPFHSDDWEHYRGSTAVNQHSVVRWSGKIEAGQEFKVEIDSHYFARH